jgi:hypothetical protein
MPTQPGLLAPSDPPVLLAMMIAARATGDRLLETVARRELEHRGIKVRLPRKPLTSSAGEVPFEG